jgi:hypothetical protein
MSELPLQRNSEVGTVDTKPQLILFSPDSALLEKLKPSSAALPYISYAVGYGPQVAATAHLDALWVTLMGSIELFGAVPPFPLHEARVLRTPRTQLEKGFPRYGVAGVAVSEDDPKAPEYGLRLVVSALLKAVKEFNSGNPDQILRIGILPDDLELKKLKPEAAFKIVREAYESA